MSTVESPGLPLHDDDSFDVFLENPARPEPHAMLLCIFGIKRLEGVIGVKVRDHRVSEPFEVRSHVLISTQANMVPCVVFLGNPQGKDRVEG